MATGSNPKSQTSSNEPATNPPSTGWFGRGLRHVLVFCALVGATHLLYRGALDLGYFNLDDSSYVVDNPLLKDASRGNVGPLLTQPYLGRYAQTHLLSYVLDARTGGFNPRTFHRSSILWAGVSAGFVYLLGLALMGRWLPALLGGLLFVAHPAHVEAVVWIASRGELVAVVFALLSILSFLRYRRSGRGQILWYALSLLCFVLALAGSLSVIVIPLILLLLDLAGARRPQRWLVLGDKIPYVEVAVLFALRTLAASPPATSPATLYTAGSSLLHNLWLLGGFGAQVPYSDRPGEGPALGPLVYIVMVVLPFLVCLLPLLLRRRVPGYVICLLYWPVLTLIPSQALGLIHPLAERHLFLPSVAICLLAGWGLAEAVRWRKAGLAVAVLLLCLWGGHTLAYIKEWQDPRSVWFAAAQKSNAASVQLYLGTHLQDAADSLVGGRPADTAQQTNVQALARILWEGDTRYAALTNEWSQGSQGGPITRQLREDLLKQAWAALESAAQQKRTILMPNLYFRRGKLAMDRGELEVARKEFTRADAEAARHTSREIREELTVRCAFAMGVLEWRLRDYEAAARWLNQTKMEQKRFGKTWIPDIDQHLTRLEGLRPRPVEPPPGAPAVAPSEGGPASPQALPK